MYIHINNSFDSSYNKCNLKLDTDTIQWKFISNSNRISIFQNSKGSHRVNYLAAVELSRLFNLKEGIYLNV